MAREPFSSLSGLIVLQQGAKRSTCRCSAPPAFTLGFLAQAVLALAIFKVV